MRRAGDGGDPAAANAARAEKQVHTERLELLRNRREKPGETRRVKSTVWWGGWKRSERQITWLWRAIQHGYVYADTGNDVRATVSSMLRFGAKLY
jgi:hypothetical protein